MQAIHTKFISATNLKGSRIKAFCDAGSITVPYTYDKGESDTHLDVAYQLVKKLGWDDDHYGKLAQGSLPNNAGYCHVFVKGTRT